MVPSREPVHGLDVVWAVSGRGMLLRAVIEAAEEGLLPVRVRTIITDRPSQIERFAAERGIPHTRLVPPGEDRRQFNHEIAEAFEQSGADWAGLTFNRLLGSRPIESMQGRVLNVHFSLLPLFPGFGAIRNALLSGMKVAGVTVHLVDETMDGGPILGQAVRTITPDDTIVSLGSRLFAAATPLLLQVLRSLADKRLAINAERLPVWARGVYHVQDGNEFPGCDPDIAEFAQRFCAAISK